MKNQLQLIIIFFCIISLIGCTETNIKLRDNLANFTIEEYNPLPKEDRLMSIAFWDVSSIDFETSFALAREIGAEVVELPIFWNQYEPSKEDYRDNEYILKISNSFYARENIKLSLGINPIDTNNKKLPDYLENMKFDDPEVIEAFKKFIDYIYDSFPDAEILSVTIGNEIDAYLNSNDAWNEYLIFYENVSKYAKTKWPEAKIGTKGMFNGLVSNNVEEFIKLNEFSDTIMVTYYPLNDDFSVKNPGIVSLDFEKITTLYKGKEIYFIEAGYPSSTKLGSSETKQKEFVEEVLKAWDTHKDQVKFVMFIWMHDLSESSLDYFKSYYGFSSENFVEYLGTLGLRTNTGEDKEAFLALKEEARIRGWS